MLKETIQKNKNFDNFTDVYLEYLCSLIKKVNRHIIGEILQAIEKTREKGGTIYFIGNGGSASTASHFVNDIGFGIRHDKGQYIKAISLSDNIAVTTALANDMNYENIFVEQLKRYLDKKDLLFAISASGNSPNIIKAVKYSKEKGITIVGCTGFNGGELKKLSDINFHVDTEKGEYGPTEDLFMILDHIIYSYFRFLRDYQQEDF